jgi:hypothetical protein
MDSTKDLNGKVIVVGSSIFVRALDSRLIEFLPEDEVADLQSVIGLIFVVQAINSDGSMVVTTDTQFPDGLVAGFDLAIFPEGAELHET